MTGGWGREDMGVGANPPTLRGGSWIQVPLWAVKYEAEAVTEYWLRTRMVMWLWIDNTRARIKKWQTQ